MYYTTNERVGVVIMSKLQNVNDYIREHGLKPSDLEIELGHWYDEENDVTWLYVYKTRENRYLTLKPEFYGVIPLQGKIED